MMIEEKNNFLQKLTWKESAKGKWYLDKREQQTEKKDFDLKDDFDILEFEMAGYDIEKDETRQMKEGDFVFSELGRNKINKIEEGQAFLQMGETEIPVPSINVKKYIHMNILIVTRSNTFNLDQIEIDINKTILDLIKHVADLVNLLPSLIIAYYKDKKIDSNDKKLHELEVVDNDNIMFVLKESPEYICKRSTSKDYSSSDRKHVTAFSTDKPIIVTGFSFFRNYENGPAVYDLSVYEVTEDGARIPLSIMTNFTVNANDVDNFSMKKANITEFEVKPHVKYFCYIDFKLNSMKTYYFNSGSENIEVEGIKFKFHDVSDSAYKCSKTSGHLPFIFFKFNCPLK